MEEEALKRRRLDDPQQVEGVALLPPPPPALQGHIGVTGLQGGGLPGSTFAANLQNTCLPGALLAGAIPGVGLPTAGVAATSLPTSGLTCGGLAGMTFGGSLPSNAIPGGTLLGATSLPTAGLVSGGLHGAGLLAGISPTGNGDHTLINGGLAGNMIPAMTLANTAMPGSAPSLPALGNNSLTQLQAQIQMLSGGGAMDPAQQEMIIKMAMEMRSKMPKKKKGEKGRAELEKMMAMMQSTQQTPQMPGAGMPDSEEELKLMHMQMQMQMQMQKDMQAGKDPMKAIADSCSPQASTGSDGDQIAASKSKASEASTQSEAFIDPSCDLLMYALGQVAEDAAQEALSTSMLCSKRDTADPTQVQAMSESAQQASQKASWAVQTMETYDPPSSVKSTWIATMRQIGKAAAEAAQYAAEQCMKLANKHAGIDEEADEEGKGDGKRGGKVPCKFFLLGKCWKGEGCEFAHEKPELKPRPLMLKREEECIYFARGQCTRGVACPFAHGPEELAEISKYVVNLKKEKQQLMRQRRN